MLWMEAHKCLAAARFVSICYWQFLQLLIRVLGNRVLHVVLVWEGVPQGDPIAVPLYSVSFTILLEQL